VDVLIETINGYLCKICNYKGSIETYLKVSAILPNGGKAQIEGLLENPNSLTSSEVRAYPVCGVTQLPVTMQMALIKVPVLNPNAVQQIGLLNSQTRSMDLFDRGNKEENAGMHISYGAWDDLLRELQSMGAKACMKTDGNPNIYNVTWATPRNSSYFSYTSNGESLIVENHEVVKFSKDVDVGILTVYTKQDRVYHFAEVAEALQPLSHEIGLSSEENWKK
jgi:hypothetical protein